MIERFTGLEGRARLVTALADQTLLRGDMALADLFADVITLREIAPGDLLYAQDGHDNDMAFLLSGTLEVLVNGRLVATRKAGHHIGEMALIDPSARRAADVIAQGTCVVAVVSEAHFTRMAADHSFLWRHLARQLADRLRQRNELVLHRRLVPHMFIGSSSEHYPVVEALQAALASQDLEVTPWKGVFAPSSFTLIDLEEEAQVSDYAVLVLGEDDFLESRDELYIVTRDNVILELGLFVGACGRKRVFLLVPDNATMKLPSDLAGITTLRYTPGKGTSAPDLSKAVPEIAKVVAREGAL